MKPTIGLDLDGVLYEFQYALYLYLSSLNKYSGDFHEFCLNELNNIPEDTMNYYCCLSFIFDSVSPSEVVVPFLTRLAAKSDLYYITSRNPCMDVITRKYINKYGFPYEDNLIFAEDKATACRLLGVGFFLDDAPKFVEAVSKVCPSFLYGRAWNREFQDKYNTVYGLKEFEDIIFYEKN